ncbi:DMT family transporter [Pinisolibacter aquiterrae]|uniref:DMT family transporter n=1 Tax=Pinisolibacter aquiterrae TaxID=2815579 RepID=UPI001E52D973|nr:DMT family transporter [Pinisolibacter aquiterrae]MCC8235041.1 DMT family transporter [Pinisolibacter aquiterrae]
MTPPAAPGAASILRGIVIMTAAMLIVPSMDVMAKVLTQSMPAMEVAFVRFVGQLLVAGVVGLVIGEGRRLIPPRPLGHVLRGLFLAATSLLFFSALAAMPLTDALAIAFAEPMILTALSPIFLGETIGWRRWAACGVGFLGTLIIIRPSFEQFGHVALLPLGSALTFAGYHIMTRKLSGQGSLTAVQFTTGLVGTVALGIVLAASAGAGVLSAPVVWPQGMGWVIFLSIGVLSFVTHGMIVTAFGHAPAAVLAPFGYLEIVSATGLSLLVFGDFPDPPTWAGIGLIVASGLYIVHRERVRGRSRALPPSA